MGSGANVNAFFGITTMIMSIRTGIKNFNCLFTMYTGRITFTVPMLWTMGFLVTFTFGGMTGVMMAIPGVDFQVHNSLFLIAHFHNTIIGGVVFGYLAGLIYWFPKITGFKLHERLGNGAFWCWNIGFYITFVPLYILGLMGMTRRLNYYTNPEWTPFLLVSVVGVALIAAGIGCQVLQLIVSIIQRKKLADTNGDPWGARTLEWSMPSPPPLYNFAVVPHVHDRDAFWDMQEKGENSNNQITHKGEVKYEDIHMPRNTAIGVFAGGITFFIGFGIIWHIWWLAGISTVLCVAFLIYRAFDQNIDYYIKASEVEAIEKAYAR
jgi:cytochrome o ubiquinol oxidase subunit 1